MDRLAVELGLEIVKLVPGYVSTEVDIRASFDTAESLRRARRIIDMYEVPPCFLLCMRARKTLLRSISRMYHLAPYLKRVPQRVHVQAVETGHKQFVR